MVIHKMRPLFTRGNSAASITVNSDRKALEAAASAADATEASSSSSSDGDVQQQQQTTKRLPATAEERQKKLVRFALNDDDEGGTCSSSTSSKPFEEEQETLLMTEEEISRCYYSSDDLAGFDKDRALTALAYIRRRQRGIAWDDNAEHSTRGIEDVVSRIKRELEGGPSRGAGSPAAAATSEKESARRRHVRNVLDEYRRLKDDGRQHDAFALAEASMKTSAESKSQALSLAKDDASEAAQSPKGFMKMIVRVVIAVVQFQQRQQTPSSR